MNEVSKIPQMESQIVPYISFDKASLLLKDIKYEIRISEKLEKISALLQRDDINWNARLFKKLISRISWLSWQNLFADSKLTLESICKRINMDERFKEFPQIRIQEALNITRARVFGIVAHTWNRISARGFHWWRA